MRQYYVAAVPLWLADIVMSHPDYTSPEIFTDFEKLSTIVSSSDVSFYSSIQPRSINSMKGFLDMGSISMKASNLQWLKDHGADVSAALDRLQLMETKDQLNDLLPSVDLKPVAAGNDTLALISCRGVSNPTTFYRECMSAISQQMTFEEFKQYDIFTEFTRT